MKLQYLRNPDLQRWDALVAGSPGNGHFLQSHTWGAMKRRFNWRPFHFVLRDSQGGNCGTALVLAYRTPLGKDLLYCPKGPWIDWQDPVAITTLLDGLRSWGRQHQALSLRFDPPVPQDDAQTWRSMANAGTAHAAWEMQYSTGWVVDLRSDEAQLLAAMKAKTRYNIRLAERKGVTVRHDCSRAALARFQAMYAVTADRDGFAPRSAEYLISSCLAMLQSGHATLIWAEHAGKELAAIMVYTFGTKAWYWLGASSNEQRQLMPTYLVQWEGMRWAKQRGCLQYDMTGIPTPEKLTEEDPLWGLYRFKSGFGGGAESLVGTCELQIEPLYSRLWKRSEPAFYRIYQHLYHDVYY